MARAPLSGAAAVDAGLADEVGTFETALSTISRGAGRRAKGDRRWNLRRPIWTGRAAKAMRPARPKVSMRAGPKAKRPALPKSAPPGAGDPRQRGRQGPGRNGASLRQGRHERRGRGRDAGRRPRGCRRHRAETGDASLAERASAGMPHVTGGADPKAVGDALSLAELAAAVNKSVARTR
jgi:hypothetical protein